MWFDESLYPDVRLKVQGKLVYKKKTLYQDLKIYKTARFGNLLLLDNNIQTTEKDEFIYHEMLVHPILLSHPNPKKVLIIGAGDGGILREVLKHKVESVCLVEIDKDVVDLSKKYLPSISAGTFNDKRTRVIIGDGAKFIRQTKEKFDAVIVDSPDPVGVAKVLFSSKFYRDIFAVLEDDGIMVRQTGSTFFQPSEVGRNYKIVKSVFSFASVYLAAIPTYIGGFFSVIGASKKIDLENLDYSFISSRYSKLKLSTKYYNPEIHFASMKLPNYIRRNIR